MVSLFRKRCQLGGVVRQRCPEEPEAQCQYCGRWFCGQHGTRYEDFQEVCGRETCQAKYADVESYKPYKRRALLRNREGLCGVEACSAALWGGCSKCEAVYCETHVALKYEQRRQGRRTWKQPVMVCPTCAARLALWARK